MYLEEEKNDCETFTLNRGLEKAGYKQFCPLTFEAREKMTQSQEKMTKRNDDLDL